MNDYEVDSNKKKPCKKASLVVHAFVGAKGMFINLIPATDKGRRGGKFFIKEKWEKSEIIDILRT